VNLPVRIYQPFDSKTLLPVLIYYHGGGFSICSIESHDPICRYIAKKANCIVVSVEYRLAPNYKFPIPIEDSYEAAKWCKDHTHEFNGDANKIGVGGDSAGGNIAAVLPQLSFLRNGPKFLFQLLIYPTVDKRGVVDYPSRKQKGKGLTPNGLKYFLELYLNNVDVEKFDHRVSPVVFDNFSQLPQALVITAKNDILRDEGEAYAKILQESGVKTTLKRVEVNEAGHGFFQAEKHSTFLYGINIIADWLNTVFEE